MHLVCIICATVFFACVMVCVFNRDTLKKRPFQQTTTFINAATAKYEKDGNLYVIDSGSFRLICMTPDGNIRYAITIDKLKEYTRIIDGAIDEAGNLYVYAMEAEYDAYLTKRDIIRKYDNRGRFVKDIISISYDDVDSNPHLFYQFGSFHCEDGILTFSRTEEDRVTLYQYDTFRDDLRQSVISSGSEEPSVHDYIIAQLVLKDFRNYAYVMRDGDIFEVADNARPELRASFNWNEEEGGIIPWYIQYDADGNLVFFDMVSNGLFHIADSSMQNVSVPMRVVPESCFEPLKERGEGPALRGFGFFHDNFAGVYGNTVWLYNGTSGCFTTYEGALRLPLAERLHITIVQLSLILGILALCAGLYVLFIGILDRYVSLFIKQTVVIIPLMIAAFIIVFSTTFKIMTERLNTALFDEIRSLAVLSAKLINGDDIDNLANIKDCRSDSYKNLSKALKEITGNNADPWNKGYYAALFKGSRFEYAVAISNDEINLFRPSEALEGEDYDLVVNGQPIGGIFSLSSGEWAFAVTPVYNSTGKASGLLEVGLDMTAYQIGNTKLKRQVALIAVAVCVVILLALSLLVSLIVKQLAAVADVLRNIASGNRTARVSYKARDELGKVSRGLNSMAEELQNQFDRITLLNESTIRFVPLQFMEHLGVSDITKMKLGDNVQRDISVLFFDIRAFSINSEMMTSRENFIFINEILSIAGPVIRKHNGFVDKYIGDAAMALFDNGMDAVRAGIELYQMLVLDEETSVKIGVDGINIGVGIHTGSVMMGIVGENERLSSTVISANVNLASRVESLSKQTKSGLLITRDTLNQLSGSEAEFAYRFLGMVQAAGVNEVVGLFDMLDALPARDKKIRIATKDVFESGVRKFHTKDYAAAVQRFEKVAAEDPQDVCAAHHLEEAYKHLQNPDLPSVFIFDKK